MKYKIAVFGSSAENLEIVTVQKAKAIGAALGKENVIVITGACTGLPYVTAYEARKANAEIIGYSPETDMDGQRRFTPHDDLNIYKKIIFTPKSFEFADNLDVCKKYRNVISVANADAGIIISGRWGTMNEFTNLFDLGKVIGVLIGTGGIADEIALLNQKIKKKSNAVIIYSNSAEELVKLVIEQLKQL